MRFFSTPSHKVLIPNLAFFYSKQNKPRCGRGLGQNERADRLAEVHFFVVVEVKMQIQIPHLSCEKAQRA